MNAFTLSAPRRRNQVVILSAINLGARHSTRKKSAKNTCSSEFSDYLCSAFHLNKATESPTAQAAGLFFDRGCRHNISSVPCGALMRPLPCSRWNATGSGTFSVSVPTENINIISFI